ncbi:MAG: FRG domain-containing protein [Myroides sp.]
MDEIVLNTVDEVFTIVDSHIKISHAKYRGQSNKDWKLIPSLGREQFSKIKGDELFRNWKRRAINLLGKNIQSEFELMMIAQHNGLPTKLLDWSHNPLVALFFAVIDNDNVDGAFFVYINSNFKHEITNINNLIDEITLVQPSAPINRISNQYGYFTIHKQPTIDLNTDNCGGSIKKFIIPKDIKKDMAFKLNHYGVNYMSIYPDLEGLGKHLSWFGENYDYWSSNTAIEI